MDNDVYAENAEFFDLYMVRDWERLAPALTIALEGAGGEAIIDIGAGTGLCTQVIARAVPEGPIIAIEPSRGLRASLFTRIMHDPDMQRRVTVIPTDLANAKLPRRFGGVVAANMIGHLCPAERQACWQMLAERLIDGAPAIIRAIPPERVEPVPETVNGAVQIGTRTYYESAGATPDGPDTVRWRIKVWIEEAGEVVERHEFSSVWWPVGSDAMRNELETHGFTTTMGKSGFVIARKHRE